MAKIYNKIIEKDGKFYQITATAEVIPDERPRIDLKKVAALNINASNAEDIINSLNKDYKPIAKYGEDGFLCTGPGYGGTLKFYSCLAKDVCGNFGGIEKTPGLIKSRGKFLFPDKIIWLNNEPISFFLNLCSYIVSTHLGVKKELIEIFK